jgi:hypothetical protein
MPVPVAPQRLDPGEGGLTPTPERGVDALRRIAGKRDDDKLAAAQAALAKLLSDDSHDAPEIRAQRKAALIVALRGGVRGPAR